MNRFLVIAVLALVSMSVQAQQQRGILRGQVIYRDQPVTDVNVVNTSAQLATISNKQGEFEIPVELGDEVVFSSLQYQIRAVVVDEDILRKNRLVVEVKEKVIQLEETVVGPDNPEEFIRLQEEEFIKPDYLADRQSRVRNEITTKGEFHNGIDFVNIYKAIARSRNGEKPEELSMKPSELLRQVYEDDFFVVNLNIPPDRIDEFLYYCDDHLPSQNLLKKDNEFQLMEFLVAQSQDFLRQ